MIGSANYERWDKGNLDLTEKKKPEMLEFEYARSALRNGLELEQELGVNPYKFGIIGSRSTARSSRPWMRITFGISLPTGGISFTLVARALSEWQTRHGTPGIFDHT